MRINYHIYVIVNTFVLTIIYVRTNVRTYTIMYVRTYLRNNYNVRTYVSTIKYVRITITYIRINYQVHMYYYHVRTYYYHVYTYVLLSRTYVLKHKYIPMMSPMGLRRFQFEYGHFILLTSLTNNTILV